MFGINWRSLFARLLWLGSGALVLLVLVSSAISYSNTITPAGIIVHHSAVPSFHEGEELDAKLLDKIHSRRGYGIFYWGRTYNIGYHYVILPDGTVQQGRPETCRGAHARGYNSYIGICLIGDFSKEDNPRGEKGPQEPTQAQMRALIELGRRLQERYHIPAQNVRRHSEMNPDTQCPGTHFPF